MIKNTAIIKSITEEAVEESSNYIDTVTNSPDGLKQPETNPLEDKSATKKDEVPLSVENPSEQQKETSAPEKTPEVRQEPITPLIAPTILVTVAPTEQESNIDASVSSENTSIPTASSAQAPKTNEQQSAIIVPTIVIDENPNNVKIEKDQKPQLEIPVTEVNGQSNLGFDSTPEENLNGASRSVIVNGLSDAENPKKPNDPEDKTKERPKWDNQTEFLMSCIATSVGLGNVWRFPFIAYENGGGAFLLAYIVVLLIIGKPMYYLETVLGQFSSSNGVKIWALSPAMKGTGYAQALGAGYVLSYYMSIIALCLYYLVMSFQSTLPWSECRDDWENCVPSVGLPDATVVGNGTSSAEHYFTKVVLRQPENIDDGIGLPLWDLTLCLFVSWAIVFLIVVRGVKSSGKAAYFLALFPYVVLTILLIRAVTLTGAGDGILFFVLPQWSKLLELKVWYAAVTQVFFSLSVCSGTLIMFSSYNDFKTNVYKYSMIVTTLDTFTSLISGITIFGILGNLAYEMKYDDVQEVIGSGGASLAFISYPDAIAKSPFVPQLFSVLFFLMMAVLGIGSGVALLSIINTILLDSFPKVSTLWMALICCCSGFLISLIYVTPGGQYMVELVDHYGGTFMRLFAAIAETIGVFWIYGLENICIDIEFMLGIKNSFYWRICWSIVTPVVMITVFMYALTNAQPLTYNGYVYPDAAYIAGNCLQYTGVALIPLFIVITLIKYRSGSFILTFKRAFGKKPTYGPNDPETKQEWREFKTTAKYDRELKRKNWFHHAFLSLYGGYRNFSKEK